jgi:hypothetical protein
MAPDTSLPCFAVKVIFPAFLEPFVSVLSILPPAATMLEPANLAGVVALGSSVTWPLLRRRRAILVVQVA